MLIPVLANSQFLESWCFGISCPREETLKASGNDNSANFGK